MSNTATSSKQGTRYWCINRGDTGWSGFHTFGTGKPRVKRCKYCHGALITEQGWFGAFVWRGDGRYWPDGALKLFAREADAQKFADARADDNVVVRWTW